MRGLSGASVSGGLIAVAAPTLAGAGQPIGRPPHAGRRPPQSAWRKPQSSYTEDEQLDMILRALDSMPEELKRADPHTYPGYSEKIAPYLEGLTTIQTPVDSSGDAEASPAFNVFGCSLALGSFVVQFGFPVFKIIAWIKKARSLWGGVSGIWRAIRSGQAAAEIGEDAVNVLSELLGVPGLVEACLS